MSRYLIDANLPYRWDVWRGERFLHVFDLGDDLPDRVIWERARSDDLVIVTKDSDFSAWALLAEPPPRVVHFRIGNLRLRDFAALVERIWPTIDQLVVDHRLIIVRTDAIEGVV